MNTLQQTCNVWCDSQRSPKTALAYRAALNKFFACGNDASALHIATFLQSLSGSPATRAQAISAVRAFLKFAMQQGLIAQSPIELLRRPIVAVTSANRYLTADELRSVIATSKKLSVKHQATVMLLAYTGMRRNEAAVAQWKHLFQDSNKRIGLLVYGKGGKTRVVGIPSALFVVLAQLHGSEALNATDATPLIQHRGKAYHHDGIWRMVRDSVAAAGINKPASPHWFRHTAATLAADSESCDVIALQQSMGHASVDTTMRYVHAARGLKNSIDTHVVNALTQRKERPRKPSSPWAY